MLFFYEREKMLVKILHTYYDLTLKKTILEGTMMEVDEGRAEVLHDAGLIPLCPPEIRIPKKENRLLKKK